ncbi:uncharacterized protein LOC128681247 isoform X1 [Plodia interpunctella]|uniref:uncharacterized protein LOC128681247 isoform X1 n=1 Tax=Plodia interpunctella TaxID=58824 RepID=UPI002367EFA6|nr:uncharacterized protein LOC128681247 isoform X1 [Plodia interpunctella]
MWRYILLAALSITDGDLIQKPFVEHSRSKRDVGGTLNIVTNHAQPIHADVKPEASEIAEKIYTWVNLIMKCAYLKLPECESLSKKLAHGVTPPKDAIYEVKSGRKSFPLTDTLDLIRSVSRVTSLVILLISAVIEFFPLIEHLYNIINLYISG